MPECSRARRRAEAGPRAKCAVLLSTRAGTEIPEALINTRVDEAIVFFGIKEAYVYRDWQAALGDLMLRDSPDAARRFDVIGFREFEDRFLAAKSAAGEGTSDRRWFGRVEAIFYDLDMTKTGMFDARREQLRRLQQECANLSGFLERKLSPTKEVGK